MTFICKMHKKVGKKNSTREAKLGDINSDARKH